MSPVYFLRISCKDMQLHMSSSAHLRLPTSADSPNRRIVPHEGGQGRGRLRFVDLNRATNGRHQRTGKAAAADQPPARPMQKGLSEETCHAMRNALLKKHPVGAYSGDYPPDATDTTPADPVATPAELPQAPRQSAETPADPNASFAQPPEISAEPIEPLADADTAAPAEAQQSSSDVTQPQLTAATRTTSSMACPLGGALGAGEPKPSEAAEALSAAEGSGVRDVRNENVEQVVIYQ
jgi:hypothetical protein